MTVKKPDFEQNLHCDVSLWSYKVNRPPELLTELLLIRCKDTSTHSEDKYTTHGLGVDGGVKG